MILPMPRFLPRILAHEDEFHFLLLLPFPWKQKPEDLGGGGL